ncbi:MAG TPA: hypothetical protein VM513_09735 [Kofleriaceae bacterium]|jgi:hypothetical protein|nr:hypothetical protein [Kofleriaceae bacterium]
MKTTVLVLALAACGGGSTDIDATMVFADRSDQEIARLISAASGTDMFGAQGAVDRFAGEADPCPAVSASGASITLTGDCTTMDGILIEGTARVTNPTAWDQVDYTFGDDTVYELTGWSLTLSSFTQVFDGNVRIESFTVWDADVTATQLGIEVRSDLHYDCDSATCDLDGSGVEIVGIGGATVSGTVQLNGEANASFRLRGRDTLNASISQGCVAWAIEGTDRQKTCP